MTTVINAEDPINSARMSVFTVQIERFFEQYGFSRGWTCLKTISPL